MKTNRAVPVQGNVVYYKNDGTGRDSYIQNHNGGLLSYDRIHHLKQYNPPKQRGFSFTKTTYGKHPFKYSNKEQNRLVHYVSDGSGRDFYIASNEGGNSVPFRWRDETGFKFKQSLRGKDKFLQKNPEENDTFTKSQFQFTMTQSKFNRSLSMTQTVKNKQLSAPKNYPLPPPIQQYFEKGFDASKQFRKHKYGKNH